MKMLTRRTSRTLGSIRAVSPTDRRGICLRGRTRVVRASFRFAALAAPRKKVRRATTVAIGVALATLLVGCVNPLTKAILSHVKDTNGPVISITSPADGSSYATTVVVDGTVVDKTSNGAAGQVQSLSYQVLATSLKGDVTVAKDGSFAFQFPTSGLSGSLTVQVSATDWNGNTTAKSLTLVNNGAIPSFTATPGNTLINLTWDPLPLAESYTLYYAKGGGTPSEYYGTKTANVESPYTVKGLENGNLYSLQVCANTSDGKKNCSGVRVTVPMSPFTLAPSVSAAFQAIRIAWPDIPAVNSYSVWRAEGQSSQYANIATVSGATSFTDSQVSDDTVYRYSISPFGYPDIRSTGIPGRTTRFPPSSLVELGNVTLAASRSVQTAGNYAYVLSFYGGFSTVDVSDPADPTVEGTSNIGSYGYSFVVRGGYAYIVAGTAGLVIVDVSDPNNPHVIGESSPFNCYGSLALSGNYAYLVQSGGTLRVFDVSDPTNPTQVYTSSWTYPSNVMLTADATHLYVGSVNQLQVIDISNPLSISSSSIVGTCVGFDVIQDLALHDGYLYVADRYNGLRVVDVSNPNAPAIISTCDMSAARKLTFIGSYCIVVDSGGLEIVDISDPTNVAGSSIVASYSKCVASGVNAVSDMVYVADSAAGLRVLSFVKPTNPSVIAESSDNRLFSGNREISFVGSTGINVDDITDPANPVPILSIQASGYPRWTAVYGDYIVAIWWNNQSSQEDYQVLDLRDGGRPLAAAPAPANFDPSGIVSVELYGDRAFLIDQSMGIRTLDLSDWSQLHETGVLGLFATAYYAKVVGSRMYVGTSDGVKIVDISNPDSLRLVGTCLAGKDVNGLATSGDMIVASYFDPATGSDRGICVIDASDSAPLGDAAILGTYQTVGFPGSLTCVGTYVCVGVTMNQNADHGMEIVDIANPQKPVHVTTLGYQVNQLDSFGDYVYSNGSANGTATIELSK